MGAVLHTLQQCICPPSQPSQLEGEEMLLVLVVVMGTVVGEVVALLGVLLVGPMEGTVGVVVVVTVQERILGHILSNTLDCLLERVDSHVAMLETTTMVVGQGVCWWMVKGHPRASGARTMGARGMVGVEEGKEKEE